MINRTHDGIVLYSGPIIRHAHVIGDETDAFVTLEVSAHANDAYVSSVYLVVNYEGSYHKLRIAIASDVFKMPHEVFRIPKLRVAVARMHKDPHINTHGLPLPHDLLRFLYRRDINENPVYFDVRFDRINSVFVKPEEGFVETEIHTIKSMFVGKYEKIRLRYLPEKNLVVEKKEEKDEYLLIE